MNPLLLFRRLPFNSQFAIRKPVLNLIQDPKSLFAYLFPSPVLPRSLALLFVLLLYLPAVVCAQWETDRRITTTDSVTGVCYNGSRYIAATGDTIHVVWQDRPTGWPNDEVFYVRSTDGGITWGPDTRLTYDRNFSRFPAIAASGPYVHAIWYDDRVGGNDKIFYKRSTDWGTTWGLDTLLSEGSSFSLYPSVASSGLFIHVVWHDYRDGEWHIYYKRSSDSGATWGSDTRIATNLGRSWYPSVAVSGSIVHVVWEDDRDVNNPEVYYVRSTDAGMSWSPDTARLTNAPTGSLFPSIAASGLNVHVVWFDNRYSTTGEIYYKRSTDSGISWGEDVRLTYDSLNSYHPNIAVSGPNIYIVWFDDRNKVCYKRSNDNGVNWQLDTLLTRDDYWLFPSVAVAGSKVHVVWVGAGSTPRYSYSIYYKRNPTGNTGVEDLRSLRLPPYTARLTVSPNPFVSFASVPSHFSDRFALYDISGRKVGVYKGDRIGEGLSAGVYFLRSYTPHPTPYTPTLRIVKVR